MIIIVVSINTQEVYSVNYKNQANLKVYKIKYQNQVGKNDGKWFFTQYFTKAKKSLLY